MNIESFMDQPEGSKGLNIVFVWKKKKMSHDEVLMRLREKANYLLTNTGHGKSRNCSLEEM